MELGVRFNDDGSITYIEWTGPYNSDFDPETYKLTELGTFTKGNNQLFFNLQPVPAAGFFTEF